MKVYAGSIDVTTYFHLRNTDGTDATGLTITNLDLQYVRSGAAPSAKVDATALAATDSAHGDNKAIEIDATDQPGLYRVDWPDAAFAAGVREVILTLKCTGVQTESLRVELFGGIASGPDARFLRAVKGITLGTVGSGSTTTSVVTSSLDPAAAVTDQFKGKILTFTDDTTTTNLRGQSTDITGSTSGGVLTVTALTTAAVSGDTFSIA